MNVQLSRKRLRISWTSWRWYYYYTGACKTMDQKRRQRRLKSKERSANYKRGRRTSAILQFICPRNVCNTNFIRWKLYVLFICVWCLWRHFDEHCDLQHQILCHKCILLWFFIKIDTMISLFRIHWQPTLSPTPKWKPRPWERAQVRKTATSSTHNPLCLLSVLNSILLMLSMWAGRQSLRLNGIGIKMIGHWVSRSNQTRAPRTTACKRFCLRLRCNRQCSSHGFNIIKVWTTKNGRRECCLMWSWWWWRWRNVFHWVD